MSVLKVDISNEEIEKLKNIYKTEDENVAVKKAIDDVLKKQVYEQLLSLKGEVECESNFDEMREERV